MRSQAKRNQETKRKHKCLKMPTQTAKGLKAAGRDPLVPISNRHQRCWPWRSHGSADWRLYIYRSKLSLAVIMTQANESQAKRTQSSFLIRCRTRSWHGPLSPLIPNSTEPYFELIATTVPGIVRSVDLYRHSFHRSWHSRRLPPFIHPVN